MLAFSLVIALFGLAVAIFRRRSIAPLLLVLSFPGTVQGQAGPPTLPSAVRCPAPGNPHRLYRECAGRPFDLIEDTLTKDWAGLRADLKELGITPTASYTTQLMGNPSGGQSRGFTYAGTLQATIYWDLDKLLSLSGLSFNVGGAWSTGKNLSARYVGNIFAVQSAYTAPDNGTNNLTLGEIYLQQQLFDQSLIVAAGRLAPLDTFGTMPVLNQYINTGILPVFEVNDPAFTAYPPGVEWGAQAIYNITATVQVAAGVFNTNQNSANGAKGGLDFSIQHGNRGALSIMQVNYLLNHAPADKGMPGQYSFGGSYNSNKFTSLSNPNVTKSGNYGVYGLFQQMVYRDGDAASQKGLTVWGKVAIAPKSSVNTIPYRFGGGLSYQGAIPGRDNDIASAGAIYGSFSRYIPRATAETVVEWNYQINLKPWLSITPDIQYVVRPSGSNAVGNALVLGTQVAVVF